MSNKLRSYVVKTAIMFTFILILLNLAVNDGISDLKVIALSFVIANFLYVLRVSVVKMKFCKKIQLLVIEGRDKIFLSGEVKDTTTKSDFFNESIYNSDCQYPNHPNLFDNNVYLINPASGLPMIDNTLDANGNMYGTNKSE